MSSDGVPERAIDIEELERDNETAFSNLRSIVAGLRGLQKLENDLFNGNDESAADAASAGTGKS